MRLGSNNPFFGKKHNPNSFGDRTGENNSFYGKTHSEQVKAKLSVVRRGQSGTRFGPHSEESKTKMSNTRVQLGLAKGEKNPKWKGGVTSSRKCAMSTTEYKQWRQEVFERDDYTCVLCGVRGGNLEADHIKPWAYYPAIRYELSNGRTLCLPCHRATFKDLKDWEIMSKQWVGCDLDGCLAEWGGWKGSTHIGLPIPAMLARVKAMLAKGITVKIFTARVCTPDIDTINAIKDWCKEHIGQVLEITNAKDYDMIAAYDDRCIQVEQNTGVITANDLQGLPQWIDVLAEEKKQKVKTYEINEEAALALADSSTAAMEAQLKLDSLKQAVVSKLNLNRHVDISEDVAFTDNFSRVVVND